MGFPRVRFMVRRLLLAVAITAIVASGTVLARRQGVYRVRAAFSVQQEQVAAGRFWRPASAPLPATRSPSAELKKNVQCVSDLSPDGHVTSPGSPEAMHIAAARARGLFREVRWDEFVATAERLNGTGEWTVRIEPKSGERDDIVWVQGEGDRVTSFGFRRRDKLRGYTGKSKKGASPGYCR
jgi:hypothetical protein